MFRHAAVALALMLPAAALPQSAPPQAAVAAPNRGDEISLLADYQALLTLREAGDNSPATLKAFEVAREKAVAGLIEKLAAAKTTADAGMPLYFLALMKGDAKEAVPRVLALYTSKPDSRGVALNTLVRIGSQDPQVRRIFETERGGGEQRLLAIELTGIADPPAKAIEFLRPLLTSTNPDERAAAVRGVAQIGPEGRAMLDAIHKASHDLSPEVRAAAARSLGMLAPLEDATAARLMEMLDEKEPVGSAAASGLGYCGAKAAPALPKMRAYTQLLPPVKALSVNMAIRKVEKAVASSAARRPVPAPVKKPQ